MNELERPKPDILDPYEVMFHKLVRVDWRDIITYGGWINSDNMAQESSKPHPCVTIGWVSCIDEKHIVISSTKGENGVIEWNQHCTIPLGCIEKITSFKE